ncbi:MAG TPA: cupin domain-containing protein [Stellaceae bacterium]|nr:cupin domain-containing protein [Stellaceae bacterium]
MATVINLNAELNKLKMLNGRTPQMTSADRLGTSSELGPYRDGGLFTSKFSGLGAWERHPNGDELVHILDGAATLELAVKGEPLRFIQVTAGTVAVVPQGAWHRFRSPKGVTLMTATPRPTDHIRTDTDDPWSATP